LFRRGGSEDTVNVKKLKRRFCRTKGPERGRDGATKQESDNEKKKEENHN